MPCTNPSLLPPKLALAKVSKPGSNQNSDQKGYKGPEVWLFKAKVLWARVLLLNVHISTEGPLSKLGGFFCFGAFCFVLL